MRDCGSESLDEPEGRSPASGRSVRHDWSRALPQGHSSTQRCSQDRSRG